MNHNPSINHTSAMVNQNHIPLGNHIHWSTRVNHYPAWRSTRTGFHHGVGSTRPRSPSATCVWCTAVSLKAQVWWTPAFAPCAPMPPPGGCRGCARVPWYRWRWVLQNLGTLQFHSKAAGFQQLVWQLTAPTLRCEFGAWRTSMGDSVLHEPSLVIYHQ